MCQVPGEGTLSGWNLKQSSRLVNSCRREVLGGRVCSREDMDINFLRELLSRGHQQVSQAPCRLWNGGTPKGV